MGHIKAAVGLLACCALYCVAAASANASMLAQAAQDTGLLADKVALPYSVTIPTALPPLPNTPTETQTVQATYTVVANATAARADLPLLYLFNGWNVAAAQYSRLLAQLAGHGFTTITADVAVDFPLNIPGLPRPGCPSTYDVPFAGLLTNFVTHLDRFYDLPAFDAANPSELLLLGHSAGAKTALDVAAGCVRAGINCAGYEPLNDTDIVGVVASEGYTSGPLILDPSIMVLYLAAANSTPAAILEQGYLNTTTSPQFQPQDMLTSATPQLANLSAADRGCVGFVEVNGMNHYGITNYSVTNATEGQVAPCALPNGLPFHTTESSQNAGIDLLADIIASAIKAAVLQDAAAVAHLNALTANPRVVEARLPPCMTGS